MVRVEGIEPIRPFGNGISSAAREATRRADSVAKVGGTSPDRQNGQY